VDHATLPTLVARNSPLAAATLRCLLSSVDYDSGIVFFGFYTASGERITTHEFQTKPHRVLAPTLCIVIPDSSSNSSNLPSFGRLSHRPSRQPTHHRRSFRRHLLSRANPTSRVPSLPPSAGHTCSHATAVVRDTSCSSSHAKSGGVRAVPCSAHLRGACTPKTRAVYYALGLPLGPLERACIEQDTVTAISFMRQLPRSRRTNKSSDTSIKSKSVLE
jgi:hypothetical protein